MKSFFLRTRLISAAAGFLWLLPFPVLSSVQDDFQQGVASFEQGDYRQAVSWFRKAEDQGMDTPSLYYNLAGSYYRLGDYENAALYFSKVREYEKLRYLGEYNLGLVALKQGEEQAARKWFASVVANGDDEKLKALAQRQLQKTEALQPGEEKTAAGVKTGQKRWSSYVSLDGGYDDNVNFAPLGIRTERSDSFSEIYASFDYLFSGNRKNGWLGEAFIYDINYRREEVFDEYEYGATLKKYLRLNRGWQTRFSLNATQSNYGGEDYQTIYRLGAQARDTLSRNSYLFLRYLYADINSDNPNFDYLDGWRQQLRAEYRLYRKQDNGRLYYELEMNDRKDLTVATGPSAGLYSYSPRRHTLRGRYTRIFGSKWRLTGDLSYRASDYPVTPNQDRRDRRIKTTLYADYRFDRTFNLRAKVEYTDNRSTGDFFTYKRTVYSLGLNKLF